MNKVAYLPQLDIYCWLFEFWPCSRLRHLPHSVSEGSRANIAVWVGTRLFEFWLCLQFGHLGWVNCPCPEQGRNPNSQLSIAISASILPIEPQDHNQPVHRNPVNGLVMIFRLCWQNWSKYQLHFKVDCSDFGPVRDLSAVNPTQTHINSI